MEGQMQVDPGMIFAAMVPMLIFLVVFWIFIIVVGWKIFTKAGQPGWASIIPIYNLIVMLQIAGKPIWWIILMFIPLVNIVVAILVPIALAEKFGKSGAFAVGLILLPIIFYPILAFGSAEYEG